MVSYEFWYVGHHLCKYISPPFLSFPELQMHKCLWQVWLVCTGFSSHSFYSLHFGWMVSLDLSSISLILYFTVFNLMLRSMFNQLKEFFISSIQCILIFLWFPLASCTSFSCLCWNPHLFMPVIYIFHYVLSHANHSYLKSWIWLFFYLGHLLVWFC